MAKAKIITTILVVAACGGAFFGGMKYQESRRGSLARQFAGPAGQRMGTAVSRAGLRPVAGEIIGSDESSITIKLQDGSSKIVLVPETAEINQATAAGRSALKVGEQVSAIGQENSDGSVTAQSIQLNQSFGLGRGGRGQD